MYTIVGFANDLAVGFTAKQAEDVELYATEKITAVNSWIENVGLTLTDKKTEVALITNSRKNTVKDEIGGYTVVSKPAITWN